MPSNRQSRNLEQMLGLYLVADPDHAPGALDETVARAIENGVTCVQLRAKQLSDRETLMLARRLAIVCATTNALFFINDRVDLALACGADGVHLGVDDLPIEAARAIAPGLFIGYSPETDEQTSSAAARGAGYLGVGPIFGTATKLDAGAAIGLETLARRCQLANIPVVGIGGITAANAGSVLHAGAAGVAVVSAILRAVDPTSVTRHLASIVAAARTSPT